MEFDALHGSVCFIVPLTKTEIHPHVSISYRTNSGSRISDEHGVSHRFPPDLRTYSAKITRISAATSRIFAYQAYIFYHASRKIAIDLSNFFIYFFVEKREFQMHQFVHIQQNRFISPFFKPRSPLKKRLRMQPQGTSAGAHAVFSHIFCATCPFQAIIFSKAGQICFFPARIAFRTVITAAPTSAIRANSMEGRTAMHTIAIPILRPSEIRIF